MFGVALALSPADFKRVVQHPKAAVVGFLSQFLLLPALTFLLVCLWQPMPSMALGMMLVAACPGGNISNFIAQLAKGNAALSVSLTAIASLVTIVLTPFNFTFWGGLYPPTAEMLQTIELNFWDMLQVIVLILGLPLFLGMWVQQRFPAFTQRILQPVRILSLLIFAGFIVVALYQNFAPFMQFVHLILGLVLIHNALALISGYLFARAVRLSMIDARTISIETGIQNSGIALVLTFTFFDGLGGMMLIAAWWGVWHIFSGLGIAYFWSKKV